MKKITDEEFDLAMELVFAPPESELTLDEAERLYREAPEFFESNADTEQMLHLLKNGSLHAHSTKEATRLYRAVVWVGVLATTAAACFLIVGVATLSKSLSQINDRISQLGKDEALATKQVQLARYLYGRQFTQAEEIANELWKELPEEQSQLVADVLVIADGLVEQDDPNALLRFADRWPMRVPNPSGGSVMQNVLSDHALKSVAYNKLGDLKLAQSELKKYSSQRRREQPSSSVVEAELIRVANDVGEFRLVLEFGTRFMLSDRPTSKEVTTGLLMLNAALKLNDYASADGILGSVCQKVNRMHGVDAAAVLRRATVVYVALGNAERGKWAFQKLKSDYPLEDSESRLSSFQRALVDGIGNITSGEPSKASDLFETVLKDETIAVTERALIYGLLSYSRFDDGKEDLAKKAAVDSLAAASQAEKNVQETLAVAAGFIFFATNDLQNAEPLVSKLRADVLGRSDVTPDMLDRIKILEARLAFARGNVSEATNTLASISSNSRFSELAKSTIVWINGGTFANQGKSEYSLMSLAMLGI